ncbi:hypothetical protein [Intestinibacter sp.]
MEVNLRCDNYFVEDKAWHESAERYKTFLNENCNKKIVFMELGVGMNTPVIIKYPFWKMTNALKNAHYICINKGESYAPKEIEKKSICVNCDIGEIIEKLGRM